MSTDSFNIQWPSGASYLEGDRGTEALGVKDIQPFIPDTIVAEEDFETDPITGSGTWTLTTSNPHTGTRCLRSAVIGSSQSTIYTFPVPGGGATHLRVWHRVSSEQGFDFFEVYRDSVAVPNLVFQLSGTLNQWQVLEFDLAGATDIIFRYVKDSSASSGLDAAFIDDLEWYIPGQDAIQNYEPFHLDLNNRVKVTIQEPIEVFFDQPIDVTLDEPIDVNVLPSAGTLNNGTEIAVAGVVVQLIAANASRKKLMIQNTGVANVRIGTTGVTSSTGVRLVPNGHVIFDMPNCPTNAIFAIREGLISSTVLVQEIV